MGDAPRHVLLIGLRTSGKSTLGRLVAERTGRVFRELDDEAAALLDAEHAGDAIDRHGLDAFRKAELDALATALASADASVIASGGGAPTAPGAAELIRTAHATTHVVYLRADPAHLSIRLSAEGGAHRPSLSGKPVDQEIFDQFSERDALYRELADRVIEVEGRTPDQIASDIADQPA